ncbi:hypothetical protein KKB64_05185 [Patescibacteria group bacterium]|nr:hypothetical protein [Patescibacteria group bacterium]MBU1473146.1 hypothetical protein [Patescibacteria group bacterium]MBU2459537.1 hypothetical protein [Patescibacteria group bacterium]MBU2544537.1 hypothetical protein [Patescibacteria group bacterium]
MELVLESGLAPKPEMGPLLQESGEIVKILLAIVKKLRLRQ